MSALLIKNLKKTYRNNVEALKGINLEVKKGDFFALLGPNGAGKSTIIGVISSLVLKNSGTVKICGIDTDNDLQLAKSKLGVVNQEFNFSQFERVIDIITTQAGFYGVDYKTAVSRADKYLKALGLWDKRNEQTRMLSGGQKRRVMIIKALIHEPDLLILDEPTAGVDIELRRILWDFLLDINKKGTTIILTTHYLEEAENLCRNIAIIDEGQIIENTSMASLLNKLDDQFFIFETKNKISQSLDIEGFETKVLEDHKFSLRVANGKTLGAFLQDETLTDVEITNVKNQTNRLEELFIKLTTKHE
ncbi:ABC transporter ATP-binding protein [SAR86 cluster bacterium]|nr:ABC transporter ATP-binding protein [SAR86 cluster bacterium]